MKTRPFRRAALRRWTVRGALLTIVWLIVASPLFVYWQASAPAGGMSLWNHRLWWEALVAAILAAVAFWAVAGCLIGLARWILTGHGPSA